MLNVAAFFEVMDKELPLPLILLFFLSLGGAGMLAGRRRPFFCLPFVTILLVAGFELFLELNDAFVGPAIREEAGLAYIALSYLAILAGIGMPIAGAVIGAWRTGNNTPTWRGISGAVGILLLSLTIYLGSGYLRYAYDAYYLYPREKIEEHYIMPLRWRDIVMETGIGSILISFLVGSAYLLRAAFRPKEHPSSHRK